MGKSSEACDGFGSGWSLWLLIWDLTVTSSRGGEAVTEVSAVFTKQRKAIRANGTRLRITRSTTHQLALSP